jgi:hypothetical protein
MTRIEVMEFLMHAEFSSLRHVQANFPVDAAKRGSVTELTDEARVHVWESNDQGLPRYLCSRQSSQGFIAIDRKRIEDFPEDLLCRACVALLKAPVSQG